MIRSAFLFTKQNPWQLNASTKYNPKNQAHLIYDEFTAIQKFQVFWNGSKVKKIS